MIDPAGTVGLMVVAHPDDETLFGAEALLSGGRWHVISLTHAETPARARRLQAATALAGATCALWDLPDRPGWSKVPAVAEAAWRPLLESIEVRLGSVLRDGRFTRVVTHGPDGEYGHVHHRLTHGVVRRAVEAGGAPRPGLEVFDVGDGPLPAPVMARKRAMMAVYGDDITPQMQRSMHAWITRGVARSLA